MDALIESLQDRAEKLEDECNALRIENSNNRKVISTLQYRNIQLEQQLLAAQEALKKRSQQLTVEDGPYSLQSFERYKSTLILPQCFDNFNFQDLPPLNIGKLPNGTYRRYSIKIDNSVDFKHIPQIMELIKLWQL